MNPRSLTPTWAETFCDLHSAATAEELWGVLLSWHGIRGSSQWDEPFSLFMRFHRDDPTNAELTAALLCTDYRWRNASHRLIDNLCRSHAFDREQLDALAETFSADAFEVAISAAESSMPDPAISVLRRPIWPPLRRWAARHQVERRPDRWRAVIDDTTALSSRGAAAAVAGVMDAAEHLLPDERTQLASIGTSHGSGIVRLAALPVVASISGVDAALALARCDSSTHVRAWKPRSRVAWDRDDEATPHRPEGSETRTAPTQVADGQTTLFDA